MGKHVMETRRYPIAWTIRNLKNRIFFGIIKPASRFLKGVK